jgi:iron complex outermembrane receptor protein
LRASYGTGIRPTRSVIRGATWMGPDVVSYSLARLQPESQSGIEAGADLLFGRALGLHLTRFDQRASGLIQPVAINTETLIPRWQTGHLPRYELQNVGAIANHGWEVQANSRLSRLNLTGSWSLVDSRVARLAPGYGGDLRQGDRMLEVPSQTFSLTAGWIGNRWATSWTAARATDWINYDRYALAQADVSLAASGPDDKRLTGAQLRTFWREYDGATRLRGNVSFLVRRGMTLVVAGDNLFGQQRGEPDNITVIPGRTITFGVRKGF